MWEGGCPERSAEASGELDGTVESKVAEESLTASVSFSMCCLPCLAGGSPSLVSSSQPPLLRHTPWPRMRNEHRDMRSNGGGGGGGGGRAQAPCPPPPWIRS